MKLVACHPPTIASASGALQGAGHRAEPRAKWRWLCHTLDRVPIRPSTKLPLPHKLTMLCLNRAEIGRCDQVSDDVAQEVNTRLNTISHDCTDK